MQIVVRLVSGLFDLLTPRKTRDWVLFLLAVWWIATAVILAAYGLPPHDHAPATFVEFYLPPLLLCGELAVASVRRLSHGPWLRFAMWRFFGKTQGGVWPAVLFPIFGLLLAAGNAATLLWVFFHP